MTFGTIARRARSDLDVTPDGNRFLLVVPIQNAGAQPTVVALNWLEQLKRKK
ncbi:MAG: hypothetical protein ABI556_03435 [Gemmatimonadales bacterium]